MTLTAYIRCDWCGEEILDGDRKMELKWRGRRHVPDDLDERALVIAEDVAHYHSGEGRECYPRVRGMLSLLLEAAPSFEQVPTTLAGDVAGFGRKRRSGESAS